MSNVDSELTLDLIDDFMRDVQINGFVDCLHTQLEKQGFLKTYKYKAYRKKRKIKLRDVVKNAFVEDESWIQVRSNRLKLTLASKESLAKWRKALS